jgi:hypothetical protein
VKASRWLFILYIGVFVFSYLTNPFTKYNFIQQPFISVEQANGQISLEEERSLRLRQNYFFRQLIWLKSGYHILGNVIGGSKKAQSLRVSGIIEEIHKLRFNPNNPYLISGDHFSTLYPRSLGIFYQTLLDPRTSLGDEDWSNRQKIYLQTTAYALDAFKNAPNLTTTIVPIGPSSVSLLNIYAYPSDTLYSLLYALSIMRSPAQLVETYPFSVPVTAVPQTATQANLLLDTYRASLTRHLSNYDQTVFDPQTGLVRTNILLSGTKDITHHRSSFYDNVVYWKTHHLAQELKLEPANPAQLAALKQRILDKFWLASEGHFLEDLSPESIAGHYYSSDWLIALMTGFLDPRKADEQHYFTQSVAYIQAHDLDYPFGLKYQDQDRPERQYFFPRFFSPRYGSTVIWSHWGMEYIKMLVLLAQSTGDKRYLQAAQHQLDTYTQNILKYQGYPEVYDSNGKMYQTLFYKSVRQTGWVVNYQQAKAMVEAATTE